MIKILRFRALLLLGFLALWLFPGADICGAQGTKDLTLTQRIALTLANSMSDKFQYGPPDVADLMQRPDFYLDEDEGMYSYSFRTKVGSFLGSGYFRIASPSQYKAPKTEEGWKLLGEDRDTLAKIWFREVRKSEAVSYNEIEATLSKGNFVLTASLRRPPDESAGDTREVILERFAGLISNAKRYGILSNILVEMIGGDVSERVEDGALLNILGKDNDETRVVFRICAADYQGKPLANVDFYTIKLGGFLGQFARVEGAEYNRAKSQYEVHEPPRSGARVELVFPALNAREFAAAMGENARIQDDFGITFEVDATFKPEKKGVVS